MFVKSYGQFWRADEVEWNPGKGARGAFRLLGRRGKNLPGLRLADFRLQHGIYILYGNHGPHYVGLTKNLGKRLKDHLEDKHEEKWDRFSWFGFREVLTGTDKHNLCKLRKMAEVSVGSPQSAIVDVEALLIRAMGLSNIKQSRFCQAEEWLQVKAHEVRQYLGKAA